VLYRAEVLTPADTVTVATNCHAGSSAKEGYVVVTAKNPQTGTSWSFNHLVGSEMVIDFASGHAYSILPVPLRAIGPEGSSTEADFDGRLDFNAAEYEQLPDSLNLDSYIGVADPHLALLNMSGDRNALVHVNIAAWNDNEFPLSAQVTFRCWFNQPLSKISTSFTESFLRNNTPNDPSEVDIDCNNMDAFETGWARIDASVATGSFGNKVNPPLLGAMCGGAGSYEGGRLLWGSNALSNGEF